MLALRFFFFFLGIVPLPFIEDLPCSLYTNCYVRLPSFFHCFGNFSSNLSFHSPKTPRGPLFPPGKGLPFPLGARQPAIRLWGLWVCGNSRKLIPGHFRHFFQRFFFFACHLQISLIPKRPVPSLSRSPFFSKTNSIIPRTFSPFSDFFFLQSPFSLSERLHPFLFFVTMEFGTRPISFCFSF